VKHRERMDVVAGLRKFRRQHWLASVIQ